MRNTLLPALLLCPLIVIGCAETSSPYTDQTAAIDPALQATTPPTPSSPAPNANETNPVMTDQHNDKPAPPTDAPESEATHAQDKVELTDDQWRAILSEQEFYVLRRSGTERPGTGRYLNKDADEAGAYHCVGCGNKLYDAKHKFHSGCGWPSFNQGIEPGALVEYRDTSHGMIRVEMRCARCDGHLGHIFQDAPDQPTGLRHCVNGVALIFVPQGQDPQQVIRQHREANAHR